MPVMRRFAPSKGLAAAVAARDDKKVEERGPKIAQTFLAPDEAITSQRLSEAQARRMGELLQTQGATDFSPGQMQGKYFVPTSHFQHLAKAISPIVQAGIGLMGDYQAETGRAASNKRLGEILGGKGTPEEKFTLMGKSADPLIQEQGLKGQYEMLTKAMNPQAQRPLILRPGGAAFDVTGKQIASLPAVEPTLTPYQKESLELQRQTGQRSEAAGERAAQALAAQGTRSDRLFELQQAAAARGDQRFQQQFSLSQEKATAAEERANRKYELDQKKYEASLRPKPTTPKPPKFPGEQEVDYAAQQLEAADQDPDKATDLAAAAAARATRERMTIPDALQAEIEALPPVPKEPGMLERLKSFAGGVAERARGLPETVVPAGVSGMDILTKKAGKPGKDYQRLLDLRKKYGR